MTTVGLEVFIIFRSQFLTKPTNAADYYSAKQFKPLMNENGLLVANGMAKVDALGRSVAGNAPYFFFWLDRKGFTLHEDEQTMEHLIALKNQGARYFIVEKSYADRAPDFYKKVFEKFRVVSKTDSAYLVDLGLPKN